MNYKRLAKMMGHRKEQVQLDPQAKRRLLKNIQQAVKQKGENTTVKKGSFFRMPFLDLNQSALSGAAAAVLIAFFIWSNSKQQGFLDFHETPQLGDSTIIKQNDTAFCKSDTID